MLTIGDDFDATREALTIWLRDMDDKLTAMEHNESADVQTRVNLIKVSLGHVKCIGIMILMPDRTLGWYCDVVNESESFST